MTTAKLSQYLIMHHITITYGTAEVQLHKTITLALHEGDRSDSHSSCCAVSLLKETQYQIERQQWGLKIGMDTVAERTLCGPDRKHSPVPSSSNLQYPDFTPTEIQGYS